MKITIHFCDLDTQYRTQSVSQVSSQHSAATIKTLVLNITFKQPTV